MKTTTQPGTVADIAQEIHDRRATFLRTGAVCALVGTLGYVLAFVLHGDLPDQTTQSLLTFIADRPWALHHLLINFCFLLWIAALMGLAYSFTDARAWVLGRLGQTAALLGMAVLLWHYNIDGPALETTADAWVAAEGADKAIELERGAVLTLATTGMFPLYVALLLGLPFMLFGLAVAISRDYPSWLGMGWRGGRRPRVRRRRHQLRRLRPASDEPVRDQRPAPGLLDARHRAADVAPGVKTADTPRPVADPDWMKGRRQCSKR
jgi:hypothetical protein